MAADLLYYTLKMYTATGKNALISGKLGNVHRLTVTVKTRCYDDAEPKFHWFNAAGRYWINSTRRDCL